jgi:hypothetical protein
MPLTLSFLRENKAALDAEAITTIPKMFNRTLYKPAYDSCYVALPVSPDAVAQVVLNITESLGAGRWENRSTMSLRYDVAEDGFVAAADPGQWAVVPYKGIVEAWVDGLTTVNTPAN